MMNEEHWHTAAELAGLQGMPGSARGVSLKAKRDGWSKRKRSGRAGAWEYAESSLPHATQEQLRCRRAAEAASLVVESFALNAVPGTEAADIKRLEAEQQARHRQQQAGARQYAALPAGSKKRADADSRYRLLQGLWSFRSHHGGGKTATREGFTAAVDAGTVELPEAVLALWPQRTGRYDPRLLQRWEVEYDKRVESYA